MSDDHYDTCDTELPASLYRYTARLTGAPVIACHNCDYVCVYWDCACDFADHACEVN